MSVLALIGRCAELGMPLDRSVIAKLERGTRQSLTVAELLVLARALNVPPLLLALPIGTEAQTEVLPGVSVDTWQAAQWFTGHDAFPADVAAIDGDDWSDGSDVEQWRQGAVPVILWRQHAELVERWRQAVQDAAAIRRAAAADRRNVEDLQQQLNKLSNRDVAGRDEGEVDEEVALYRTMGEQANIMVFRVQESLRWAERSEDNARDAEEKLRALRTSIRDLGLLPPPLVDPDDGPTLSHIDGMRPSTAVAILAALTVRVEARKKEDGASAEQVPHVLPIGKK